VTKVALTSEIKLKQIIDNQQLFCFSFISDVRVAFSRKIIFWNI